MQHTLISPIERKKLRREYHVRAWIILLFTICVAGIVGVTSLIPSFMRAALEERTQLDAIAVLERNKKQSGVVDLEQELVADKLLLSALAQGSDQLFLSVEIQDLIALKGTVRLTSFALERGADGQTKVIILGVAPTRESLLTFKNRIETSVPGTVTTLPISQLAKSTQIQFSMEIIRPKS
jgi:hypothetical protein